MINREFIESIFDILRTFQEVAVEMQKAYANENYELYFNLSADLIENATEVRNYALNNMPKDDKSRIADACTCIIESANNIARLADEGSKEVAWKLEFELENIIVSALFQLEYYYWVAEGLETEEQFKENLSLSHIMKPLIDAKNGKEFLNDLSIVITGYNKLEYTKECVENILKNIPEGNKAEVILFNHGSSDETQEYFESIANVHVLNYAVNSAIKLLCIGIHNGKYVITVSNDVIVGKNALKNMYRALSEYSDYGYVVPTTCNVSNLQSIDAEYNSFEEFEKFTLANNIYDVKRHEQRVRLCNPLSGFGLLNYYNMTLEMSVDLYFGESLFSFPDDKVSLWMRRNGLKNILMKDSYCHHYGSVTLKDDKETKKSSSDFFILGRKQFYNRYGVDPWGTGSSYDYKLIEKCNIQPENNAAVLGINAGLGANPLKIREEMKEKGANNVKLINVTQNENFLQDLRGISDEAYLITDLADIITKTGRKEFKYIVVDDVVEGIPSIQKLVAALTGLGINCEKLMVNRANSDWLIFAIGDEEA